MAWVNKAIGGYSTGSGEARTNANKIVDLLQPYGFSLRSICAILGNIQGESGMNPWRWQGDRVQSVNSISSSVGYGLFQFTPPTKYINSTNYNQYYGVGYAPNFSDQPGGQYDGSAQIEFFNDGYYNTWIVAQSNYDYYYTEFSLIGIDISTFYWTTSAEFKSGAKNGVDMPLEYLTGAFELCYERPRDIYAASGYEARCIYTTEWWSYFQNEPPTPDPDPPLPPDPPTPPPHYSTKKMPLWMMLRRYL